MSLLLAASCGDTPAESAAERGKRVYATSCTACHHPDPAIDGTLGPAVAGSSRALLEARVVRAEYPPGYTPKRNTEIMVALPFLEGEIDVLAAYLAEGSGS